MSQLLVGAGGWAYFQVPGTDSLEAYSQAFDLVELNSSYYHLPSISSASEWRKRVRDEFRFSVRCPRILVDHYGLNLLPGARLLIERLEEVCEKLEAEVMTILIGAGSPIKESELAARVRDFLGTFSSGGTAVSLEFRGMRPSGEVFDLMKESGAIHSVDLSNSEPRYEGRVLYSRLFGKGEENIYEFDDRELKEIEKRRRLQPRNSRRVSLPFTGYGCTGTRDESNHLSRKDTSPR